jgi:hypothetical protein
LAQRRSGLIRYRPRGERTHYMLHICIAIATDTCTVVSGPILVCIHLGIFAYGLRSGRYPRELDVALEIASAVADALSRLHQHCRWVYTSGRVHSFNSSRNRLVAGHRTPRDGGRTLHRGPFAFDASLPRSGSFNSFRNVRRHQH